MKKILLAVAAGCAGASGLALETLLMQSAGLALGYGRSAAIGLAVYIACWAVGAYVAGTRGSRRAPLLYVGGLLALAAGPLVSFVIHASSRWPGSVLPPIAAVGAISIVGVLQGAFLPLLTRAAPQDRGRAAEVSILIAASLFGSVLGAHLLGDRAVAAFGRTSAAWLCGACALIAGALGWLVRRSHASIAAHQSDDADMRRDGFARGTPGSRTLCAYVVVGLTTAWMSAVQWIGLRLGVLWLDGMQPALNAIVCAALLALGVGAWIVPRVVRLGAAGRGSRGLLVNLTLCVLGTSWFAFAGSGMRILGESALRNPTASSENWKTALENLPLLVRAIVLVGPALVAFGGVIPVLHAMLADLGEESGARLGRLYLHEAWGALLGIPLLHLYVAPLVGLNGALAGALGLGALSFCFVPECAAWMRGALAACTLAISVWIAREPAFALQSPPLSNPALTVRALREDRDFCVAVVDDGMRGERTLLTDGFRAAGTGEAYRYMRVLGHLPLLMHPAPRRVAVLALGTGTTVGSVSLHAEVERIEVLEISAAVVDMSTWFAEHNRGALAEGLPGLLADGDGADRITVRLGDGRAALAHEPGAYDVITMEPLLPDSPFAVYLYTREFYGLARRALADRGLLCQWVPPHALEPETFEAVVDAFAASFEWSSVWWFGSQVMLLGGREQPRLHAARFADLDPALAGELSALGLATPCGLTARYVGDGAAWRTASRELTDADPWVIYRPRRRGAELLTDLPNNLAEIRRRGSDPPAAWTAACDGDEHRLLACIRELHAVEEAHARAEARLRGAEARPPDDTALPSGSGALDRAPCTSDPEVRAFREEQRFLDDLRQGVALLAIEPRGSMDEVALSHLLSAAEARRHRADVHLYLAVVLERLGSGAADRAVAEASDLCPRISETREGLRARSLGLSDEAWAVLRSHR